MSCSHALMLLLFNQITKIEYNLIYMHSHSLHPFDVECQMSVEIHAIVSCGSRAAES